jgi:hypothetical protein
MTTQLTIFAPDTLQKNPAQAIPTYVYLYYGVEGRTNALARAVDRCLDCPISVDHTTELGHALLRLFARVLVDLTSPTEAMPWAVVIQTHLRSVVFKEEWKLLAQPLWQALVEAFNEGEEEDSDEEVEAPVLEVLANGFHTAVFKQRVLFSADTDVPSVGMINIVAEYPGKSPLLYVPPPPATLKRPCDPASGSDESSSSSSDEVPPPAKKQKRDH